MFCINRICRILPLDILLSIKSLKKLTILILKFLGKIKTLEEGNKGQIRICTTIKTCTHKNRLLHLLNQVLPEMKVCLILGFFFFLASKVHIGNTVIVPKKPLFQHCNTLKMCLQI